jgi:hypothetical protein
VRVRGAAAVAYRALHQGLAARVCACVHALSTLCSHAGCCAYVAHHLRSAKNCMCATPQPLCSASSGPNPRGQCWNAAPSGARAKLAERGRWGGVAHIQFFARGGAAHIQFFARGGAHTILRDLQTNHSLLAGHGAFSSKREEEGDDRHR